MNNLTNGSVTLYPPTHTHSIRRSQEAKEDTHSIRQSQEAKEDTHFIRQATIS